MTPRLEHIITPLELLRRARPLKTRKKSSGSLEDPDVLEIDRGIEIVEIGDVEGDEEDEEAEEAKEVAKEEKDDDELDVSEWDMVD